MSNVVTIGGVVIPNEPDPNCVEVLTDLLQLAKDGQVVGVVFAAQYYDGLSNFGIAGVTDSYSTIGALQTAGMRLLVDQNDT